MVILRLAYCCFCIAKVRKIYAHQQGEVASKQNGHSLVYSIKISVFNGHSISLADTIYKGCIILIIFIIDKGDISMYFLISSGLSTYTEAVFVFISKHFIPSNARYTYTSFLYVCIKRI